MPTLKLSKEVIAALPVPATGQAYYWDTEQTGLGVVIGHTGVRSYVVSGRVRGVKGGDGKDIKRRVTIGIEGQSREDGHVWTLRLARDAAKGILADMARGLDPNATRRKPDPLPNKPGAPTLRDGVEAHLAKLRAKRRSERTIGTFEHETSKYLGPWLDTPINDLDMEAVQVAVKRSVATRAGAVNERGAMVANRCIAHVSASWNSLNQKLRGALGHWNPARTVNKDVYIPSHKRIYDLKDYAARVATMRSPIRRDGLMFTLYTGLRHEDVREIRWVDVNLDERTLHRPDPKGGAARAFTIPLSTHAAEILKRRKRDNTKDLGGDDGGWVFPAFDQHGKVGPISDLRQTNGDDKRFPVEDVHTLRRTWESIAQEEGISELDQHVLSNHSYGSHNVNATYISQHIDHLAACAEKIDAGITRRIKGSAGRPSKSRSRRG